MSEQSAEADVSTADDAGARPSRIPTFVSDLWADPGAMAALLAGAFALFVAGLDPKVFGSGTPDMQRALRERPALENLFLLAIVVQAGFYLVGGAAGDILGSRRVLLAGLATLAVGESMAVVWADGPVFVSARVVASAAIGLVIPTAIAMVAMAYTGATRATALGAAYGMLGLFSGTRVAMLLLGVAVIIVFLVWQRRVRDRLDPTLTIDLRPVTVALFAGVVVAFAQIAPSLEAPIFFRVVQGWGPLAATVAIAPFVIALLVAGPVAGILLRRYRPRTLVAGGLLALGLGDLAFALIEPTTPYLYFIVPFIAIGAGFVIATTVRTAIIFAATPRRLPSTAAASTRRPCW